MIIFVATYWIYLYALYSRYCTPCSDDQDNFVIKMMRHLIVLYSTIPFNRLLGSGFCATSFMVQRLAVHSGCIGYLAFWVFLSGCPLFRIWFTFDVYCFLSARGLLGRRMKSNFGWLRKKSDASRRGRGERWHEADSSNTQSYLDVITAQAWLPEDKAHGRSDRHFSCSPVTLERCRQQKTLPSGGKSRKRAGEQRWALITAEC